MRRINFKKALTAVVFATAVILGTTEVTNAQWRSQDRRERERIERQRESEARQQERYYNNRYRVYRNGSYYTTDSRGAELLRQAVNRGYQQGMIAGRNDRLNRRSSSYYYNSNIYRSGNYGYQSHVDSSQYRYYFQQGFERGYQDGYYSRYQYGSNNNGAFNILGNILNGILNIQRY
jgi:flagellar biosynthesis/type III secretory pathway protein FliH